MVRKIHDVISVFLNLSTNVYDLRIFCVLMKRMCNMQLLNKIFSKYTVVAHAGVVHATVGVATPVVRVVANMVHMESFPATVMHGIVYTS